MRCRLIAVLWVLYVGMWPVEAEGKGVLRGKVVDDRGKVLPGATVVVQGHALSRPTGAIVSSQGAYRIELPAGTYTIGVSFVGYGKVEGTNVVIDSGATVTLDFTLVAEALMGQQIVVSISRRKEKALDAPASVAVVDAADIRDRQALSIGDYVKAMPSVDHSKTGLAQNNTVIRGFNNVFSGTVLMLVDNRIARVPSLRVNANHFIPTTGEDIERIELVLGPGSALYGPNSANGVMHIITRSPFGSEGNSISVSGGERSLLSVSGQAGHRGVFSRVSPGYAPRPSLSAQGYSRPDPQQPGVAGVCAPAFVERRSGKMDA